VNIAVFFTKNNENTYPKGRALMQMYRVVPQTKRGNSRGHFIVGILLAEGCWPVLSYLGHYK